ncbi:zinc finger protein OZF-like isoform X18 [Tribolium madens]|uniref:zinc finger protein OZF-like isoform X18 n=1 Tax=Tribolium madens TaxID=41895 RepID=UPI001CF71F6A|nr:zinc finger protein OZF-like isoform X18 [Tribolium madens]
MGSIENISELCRLCLVKDQVNVPIFEENASKEQTFVKINSCLPVKVSRDDSLPKKICDGCSCKLDMLYNFRNTSVDSEKQLLKWLNQADLSCSQSAAKDPLASTKPEIMIKQETFEPTDSRGDDNSDMGMDTHSYLMQQQKLPYPQEFEFGGPSESNVGLMTDEPAPKRAKRAAALNKAPIETDDDDLDAAMQITKAEEEDSEEIDQPDYVEAPSTSADDQPGPSGVGKASVEAPNLGSAFTFEDRYLEVSSSVKDSVSVLLYKCRPCDIIFEKKQNYVIHFDRNHKSKRCKCKFCGCRFVDDELLQCHYETHFNYVEQLYCKLCDKYLSNPQNYIKHQKRHESTPGLLCCGRIFSSEATFQRHRDFKHATGFTCHLCEMIFTTKDVYKKHMDVHAGKLPYGCGQCEKRFKNWRSLTHHVDVDHEGKHFICEVCGKELSSRRHLAIHSRIHTGEKPYSCDICNKRFARKDTLTCHSRVHTKEKPFMCQVCSKTFSQKGSLSLHIKSIHKNDTYDCAICAKTFVSQSSLKAHTKSHLVI